MLDKEIKNNLYVMRVESGIGHLSANQGCGLFEGEFTSDNDMPSSDKESKINTFNKNFLSYVKRINFVVFR